MFNTRKLNLIYWRSQNFGDMLSPYIVSKLSGLKIQYKKENVSFRRDAKKIIKVMLRGSFSEIKEMCFFWQHTIVAVGSVLNLSNSKSKIWGAGFMSESQYFFGGEVFALRGPYSHRKICANGIRLDRCVYGDPALLLPLIYTPKDNRNRSSNRISIIPHWTEVEYFKGIYKDTYNIIDVRTTDIEHVIDEIINNKYVLSTSLHGIIVAHAYEVPCLWIKRGYIHTDGIKFKDYFSSVNISVYDGFTNLDDILNSPISIESFFENNINLSLPKAEIINTIRKELLIAAPFQLKDEYKKIINE